MEWFKKTSYKIIDRINMIFPLPLTKKEKTFFVNLNHKFVMFLWFIARSIFFIYVFTNIVYKRVGFDKTIITILVIIFMTLWYSKINK